MFVNLRLTNNSGHLHDFTIFFIEFVDIYFTLLIADETYQYVIKI